MADGLCTFIDKLHRNRSSSLFRNRWRLGTLFPQLNLLFLQWLQKLGGLLRKRTSFANGFASLLTEASWTKRKFAFRTRQFLRGEIGKVQ